MDFQKLLNLASDKQKKKEKELVTNKVGFTTHFTTPSNSNNKKQISEEKRKKLEQIRARSEANSKKKPEAPKVPQFNDGIMDFTGTGLSENDIRRKKLSDAEMARKRKEFQDKVKHLKANPVRPEDEPEFDATKVEHKSPKDDRGHKHHSKDKHRHREGDKKSHHSDKSKHHHSDKKSSSSHGKDSKHKKHTNSLKNDPNFVTVKKTEKSPAVVKKKKPVSSCPPPMSFNDLLNAAAKNKGKCPEIEETPAVKPQKPEKKEKEKSEPPSRPMTQEEKDRAQRVKSIEYQRWLKYGGDRPADCPTPKGKTRVRRPRSKEVVSDHSDDDSDPEPAKPPPPRPVYELPDFREPPKQKRIRGVNKFVAHTKEQREEALRKAGYGTSRVSTGGQQPLRSNPPPSSRPEQNGKLKHKSENGHRPQTAQSNKPAAISQSRQGTTSKSTIKPAPKPSSKPSSSLSKPSSSQTKKPSQSAQNGSNTNLSRGSKAPSTTQKRSAEAMMGGRVTPPPATNPWDRIYEQIQKNHPKPAKKPKRGNVIDSEDEYDSEMDDFIDDDDDFIDDSGAGDYSRHIQEIFKYDKRKYTHMDDDIDDMEVGFGQQMREEARSAKIGLMEDLEDMRQEQEELKRKQLMKMKAKKMKTR